MVIGLILGIKISPISVLIALPIMLLVTFWLGKHWMVIASFMGNLEGFGAIQTFRELASFFPKRALFPLKGGSLPPWLTNVAVLNPLTYALTHFATSC